MSGIIPTIFATESKEFHIKFNKLQGISQRLHIDIMDGIFVPTTSMPAEEIPPLENINEHFEAHLMVANPSEWIPFCADRGFHTIIFHRETCNCEQEVEDVISLIQTYGLAPMLAKNPETDLAHITGFVDRCPIMLMGVNPGQQGQHLIPHVRSELQSLRIQFPHAKLQVDGGVNEKTIALLIQAGADTLNCGSAISESEDPALAYHQLTRIWHHAVANQ